MQLFVAILVKIIKKSMGDFALNEGFTRLIFCQDLIFHKNSEFNILPPSNNMTEDFNDKYENGLT